MSLPTRIAGASILASLMLLQASPGAAQTPPKGDAEAVALAKATQNPVADMVSIPLQFNFYSGGGLGSQTQSITNFQPVFPLAVNAKWNVIARTIVPFTNLPLPSGERSTGIGDIQEQLFFTPAKPGSVIWGIGPQLSLPTATNSLLATGQFAAGPTAVVLAMPGNFVTGVLVNNVWRVTGGDGSPDINQFFLQPFLNLNLARGWAISSSPAITANWSAPSGEEWTVPVGLGISKVDRIGSQPVSLALQYYHLAVHPSGGPDEQWRLAFTMLHPRKK